MQNVATNGGIEVAIATRLSVAHRDNPATCTLAALRHELARVYARARGAWAECQGTSARVMTAARPPQAGDPPGIAPAAPQPEHPE